MNRKLSSTFSRGLPGVAWPFTKQAGFDLNQGVLATVFVIAYVLLDWVVQTFSSAPLAETPWNPPPGLGLACLLIFGLSWTPVIFIAAALAELVTREAQLPLFQSLLHAVVLTVGFAGLAALLRSGPLSINPTLQRMRDMILLALGAGAASFLMAGAYVLLRPDISVGSHWNFARHLIRHWIGDLIGILVFTPLLLLLWSGRLRFSRRNSDAFAHAFGIFIASLLAFWVVYGARPAEQITSLYLVFLPLIWASLRFGLNGAIVTSLAIQLGVIFLSHLGSQSDATVLQFQIRLLVIALTALFLGAAVDDLHNVEQKLRERQSELDRSLRLAASAELASAMAHELNQPLSAIGIYTRSCEIMMQSRPAPELHETMGKISAEVKRAGDVVHKLREFYRSGSSRLEAIAVGTILRSTADNIRERAARHGVDLIVREVPGLPRVLVDQVQIGTALHNLLSNAIDAIRDAECRIRRIGLSAEAAADNMVAISVTDTGPGMSAREVEQLFKPFSSSKSYGLGLGLSMSRSIVEGQGGSLQFIPGDSGSCFRITLPASRETNED